MVDKKSFHFFSANKQNLVLLKHNQTLLLCVYLACRLIISIWIKIVLIMNRVLILISSIANRDEKGKKTIIYWQNEIKHKLWFYRLMKNNIETILVLLLLVVVFFFFVYEIIKNLHLNIAMYFHVIFTCRVQQWSNMINVYSEINYFSSLFDTWEYLFSFALVR